MRHHKTIRKFKRDKDERRALLRSLATALIKHGKINTTEAKAKELRPYLEKMVSRARKGDTLASRRLIISRLGNKEMTTRLFKDIAPKYRERPGGYTRVIKLGSRGGDGAKVARIEFV